MKCSDARELINAYIDNSIDPANDPLLQEHLAKCPGCRAELEFLKSYKKNLTELRPVKAPPGFMHELRRRLESETNHPLRRYFDAFTGYFRSMHIPVEAAALVIIGSVIFVLYRPDRLIIHRIDVPVDEYSETTPAKERASNKPASSSVNKDASKKTYADYDYARSGEMEKSADKAIPAGGIKQESDDTLDRKQAKEVSGNLKMSPDVSDELASADRESNYMKTEEVAEEKIKSERSESRVMGKQLLDAATAADPEYICRRHNAEILETKKLETGYVEYTVEVTEENAEALITGLRKHFTVKTVSRETRNGRLRLVLEIKK